MEQGTQTNEEVHVLSTSSFLHEESRLAAPLPAAPATGQQGDGGCSSDAQLKQLNDEITKLTKFRVKVSWDNFFTYLAPHNFLSLFFTSYCNWCSGSHSSNWGSGSSSINKNYPQKIHIFDKKATCFFIDLCKGRQRSSRSLKPTLTPES